MNFTAPLGALNSNVGWALDFRRKMDLRLLSVGLERYFRQYGTYKITSAGSNGDGDGFVSFMDAVAYRRSITSALFAESMLPWSELDDPIRRPGYMLYLCDGGKTYALFSDLQNPTNDELNHASESCQGSGTNGAGLYGKAFSVTFTHQN